jgi:phosphatidylglycerophosphatase C
VSARKIAFFDFDGTITTKDTLLEVIKFQKGLPAFYLGFLLNTPWLIAYKLKIITNDSAKQRILVHFFGGMSEAEFQSSCDLFAEKKLPLLIRAGALEELRRLRTLGFEMAVVSASAGNWIRKWTNSLDIKLISTKLEVKNGFLTGKIDGKNCYGEEKADRIREFWNLADYEDVYVYGDSSGDGPMLSLATRSFYKPFRTA